MKKQYVVFGGGKFGGSIAVTLQELGCEIILVDRNPELVQELIRQGNNLNQLAKQMNSRQRVSAEQISLTAYACQAAYMDVVRFVDVWNIKLKKMKKEDDDHADNGD